MKSKGRQINGWPDWDLSQWRAPAPPDKIDKARDWQIQPLAKQEDWECVLLGKFGIAIDAISRFTGLSKGKVYLRLKREGVSVKDFRNGRGHYAQLLFKYVAKRAALDMTQELRTRYLTDAAIEV